MSSKVLLVLPNDNLGGAEQYLKMVAEYYYNLDYEIYVFFLKEQVSDAWGHLESDRFHLHFTRFTREKTGVLAVFINLFKHRKLKFDKVFTSHIHVNSFVSLMRKMRIINARKHIARESTSTFERYSGLKLFVFKLHYKINYNKIDLLICQTDYMRNQLKKSLPELFEQIKIKTIPNPINLSQSVDLTNNKITLSDDFIVSAGRFIPEKGFDILIESFNLLQNDFPNLQLVILGEGGLRSELEEEIKKNDLENKVILPGFVNNVYSYFNAATLCVVSSRIEGFPNVLLQMMSQNNRVVSTLCAGGIEELKGVTTCETNSVDSLYNAMAKTIEMNTSENRNLFDKELKNRSIENFVNKIEEYIND